MMPIFCLPKHLGILGYIQKPDSKGRQNERWCVNPWFDLYAARNPLVDFDPTAYNVIRDTHDGVNRSILKYDLEPGLPPDFRRDVWEAAVRDALQVFGFLERSCRVKTRGEVILDPDTSPGTVYKWLGCRAKIDGVVDFPEIDEWLWEHGWEQNYPVLFKQAGKVELVKRKKIADDDIRGFTVAPLDFLMFSARLKQDFNEKLSAFANNTGHNPVKVGMVVQHGGFSRHGAFFDRPQWRKLSEDIRKYDSTYRMFAAKAAEDVRVAAHNPESMPISEFRDRLTYTTRQDICSFVQQPSGQVLLTEAGLKSGTGSTSYDGSIVHVVKSCYVWRRVSGLNASEESYPEMRQHFEFAVYSDDKNSAVSPKYQEKFTFEARAKAYAELGLILDQGKDVDSMSMEGHQWLGKTFHLDTPSETWVPVANRNKVLCSLRNMEGTTPDDIILVRALALMVEATFTDVFDWLRGFVLDFMQSRKTVLEGHTVYQKWLYSVPTRRQCERFWLGQETSYD